MKINKTRIQYLLLFVMACSNMGQEKAKELNAAEIKEYQGEKLGSINDFRENSIKGVQKIAIKDYRLEVTGLVRNPGKYSYDELVNNFQSYKKLVTIYCVEGWNVKIVWQGVRLKDLLAKAEYDTSAKVVIFYADDGYSTSLDLNYILKHDLILAYKMNDVVLPPARGFPLQLVAEDKWGYKWVKWLAKIEVSNDTKFRGFWESRGYNQNGDLQCPEIEP